jgi:hypothetical protein
MPHHSLTPIPDPHGPTHTPRPSSSSQQCGAQCPGCKRAGLRRRSARGTAQPILRHAQEPTAGQLRLHIQRLPQPTRSNSDPFCPELFQGCCGNAIHEGRRRGSPGGGRGWLKRASMLCTPPLQALDSFIERQVGDDAVHGGRLVWCAAGKDSPGVGGVSPMLLPPVAVLAPPQLALPAPWSPHTPQLAM